MEIARYTFEQRELGAISKAKRRALGGVTLALVRRFGSPEHLSFAEDAIHDIAAIMSPIDLPETADATMPAFNASKVDGKYVVKARLPGVYKQRFPLAADITYQLHEPRRDVTRQNMLAIIDAREASILCFPDRFEKMGFPSTEELTADFAVNIAAKALRRLHKENRPGDAMWQIAHAEVE